jgi:hypothetical protein
MGLLLLYFTPGFLCCAPSLCQSGLPTTHCKMKVTTETQRHGGEGKPESEGVSEEAL